MRHGDRARAQARREAQVHQSAKGGLRKPAGQPKKGEPRRDIKFTTQYPGSHPLNYNFPAVPASDQRMVLQTLAIQQNPRQ